MHLYFKNNETIKGLIYPSDTTINGELYGNRVIMCSFGKEVFISVPDDTESIPDELKKDFIRATIREIPKYHFLMSSKDGYAKKRLYGKYRLGKALATLLPNTGEHPYSLNIETSDIDGFQDMRLIQERLYEGTIIPYILYGNEQRKIHPLDVLKSLIADRKLNRLQRFFLALRLTKAS